MDRRRGVDPGRRRHSRAALPRPHADGQGLPAARPAWSGPCPAPARTRWARTRTIPILTLEVWRARIRRHPGELKNLLRNQEFVAGIGNAYSDEILHAARLLPSRKRGTLAPEEVDELYAATSAPSSPRPIAVLRERVPPTFETEVRDFLAVHGKGGQPCPRCGHRITQTEAGGFITSYCRHCQH